MIKDAEVVKVVAEAIYEAVLEVRELADAKDDCSLVSEALEERNSIRAKAFEMLADDISKHAVSYIHKYMDDIDF